MENLVKVGAIVVIIISMVVILLAMCSPSKSNVKENEDYEFIEKEVRGNGTLHGRIIIEDENKEDEILEHIVKEEVNGALEVHAMFIHVHIRDNNAEDGMGKLLGSAKYARTNKLKAVLGIDETLKLYYNKNN